MIRRRPLGRTGLDVSECTIGTSALGRAGPAEARAMIARALDHGVDAIEMDAGDDDTASLLNAVRDRSLNVFARVTSLIPFDLPSPHVLVHQAYPGWHIRAQTEALLSASGVERLAVQQLHAWCPEWLREDDWLETLDRLRAEGKIAGFGVSLFDHDVEAALEIAGSGMIDTVQVMVNIFDQGAAAALLPLCERHDVGVIARSPLYYGALAGAWSGNAFAPDDWRNDYFFDQHRRETEDRVRRIACEPGPSEPMSDLALRFCLSHPAVSTVAVGMRTRGQLEANVQALLRGRLSSEKLAQLAQHAWLC